MEATLRKRIISNFKLQGLSLKAEASSYLIDTLSPYAYSKDLEEIIERIIEAVQQQPLTSAVLPRDVVEKAVDECNEASDTETDKAFIVIDAFSVPSFKYFPDKRKFFPNKSEKNLHGEASDVSELWKNRYTIVHQATLRHELFAISSSIIPSKNKTSTFQLKTVEYLLSTSGSAMKVLVLGMVVQLKEGKYHLEDTTGTVEIDLTETQFQTGLFVENCLVLAEGVYNDGIFSVLAMGFPPPEPSDRSRMHLGNVNFFGGPFQTCAKLSVKLQAMEEQHAHSMFVCLSDMFLDDDKVLARLHTLFTGYASSPPVAFIFMGNFSSAPYGSMRNSKMVESFKVLGDMIAKFPTLVLNSQFLFIPGPSDPGPGNILPRPPLPSVITRGLADQVPSAVFCTNPCRIQFCTQEVVVFREDLMNKMCRNYIKPPKSSINMSEHLVKTLLSQAHLCPLPLHVRPVYWQHDHALQLYPLPDVIILGDYSTPFTVKEVGCVVTNVGSFPRNGYEFKVYLPGARQVDDSAVREPV
jgi:DNA polymerase epsilon subunit 2